MQALIYCRVSTAEQTQNLSLATQEAACREYCARHGYDVADVFVDAGESAKTTNRPQFLALLKACRAKRGAVHAVVVYSLTRFSRNTADHHTIAALLRGQGIALRSVTEPIDDSPSGRLMEGILAAMAQFDNDVRSERVVAGMKAAASRGHWVGFTPMGYRRGDRRSGPSLVIDPVMGPLVQQAFALVATGQLTGTPLLAHLQALGLKTRRGEMLSKAQLYHMLRNPVYIGRIESARTNTSRQGDFEPLVSEETFIQVEQRLSGRGTALRMRRHRDHPMFPLRRFVRCAVCDKPLTGSASKGRTQRYGFYHCAAGCTRVRRELLEERFVQLLDALVPSPGYLRALRHIVLRRWELEREEQRRSLTALNSRIAAVEHKLKRLDQLFIYEEAIDAETYRQQRDALREDMALAKMAEDQGRLVETDLTAALDHATHALQHASALWTGAASAEERQRIQAVFFPEGLSWKAKTGFVEPRNVLAFFKLGQLSAESSDMVDLIGLTWNQMREFLAHFEQLKRAA